jgi:hypothetical protein
VTAFRESLQQLASLLGVGEPINVEATPVTNGRLGAYQEEALVRILLPIAAHPYHHLL